jgi:hypothetical protein
MALAGMAHLRVDRPLPAGCKPSREIRAIEEDASVGKHDAWNLFSLRQARDSGGRHFEPFGDVDFCQQIRERRLHAEKLAAVR